MYRWTAPALAVLSLFITVQPSCPSDDHDFTHLTDFTNNGSSLEGEAIDANYMQDLLADWKEQYGTARVSEDLTSYLSDKTYILSTADERKRLYFDPDGTALWVSDQFIDFKGIWYTSVDADDIPTVCVTYKEEEYCSYLYIRHHDFSDEAVFLRPIDEQASAFHFWEGPYSSGKNDEIEAAIRNEPTRQVMQKDGVNPKALAELIATYRFYSGVAACNTAGLVFNEAEVKALEAAVEEVEQAVPGENYQVEAQAHAEKASQLIRIMAETNLGDATELCQRLRFVAEPIINRYMADPEQPLS